MESVIGTDAPLDYVEFQLFPNQDRYEAFACNGDATEKIASGLLGQLVLHVPKLKDLFSRGSKACFQVQRPEDLDTSQWFTKATITRFLHIVGSMDTLNATTSIQNEITQLEEAKKFHLSLYTKDENETAPPDMSKNELVRAMELRLTALKREFATAFNRAAGTNCFPKHISDMEKLAQHLGDMDLRNTLHKFLELCPMGQNVNLPINSSTESVVRSDEKTQVKKPSSLDTPVKYGVSPAKAAQIERQSSTESEKSSESSEDEQPSVERSRSLARSASPRRSASPMRRVQIGRSGSRRATALTIKSLSYLPVRDRTQSHRDADSSEEEGSDKLPKKTDSNALRISVKDAISLFENKQKDHISDSDKRRSTLDTSLHAKKSVLRRWSAGVQDPESVSESCSQLNSDKVEAVEEKTDVEIIHGDNKTTEDDKVDEILHSITERMSKPMDSEPDILVIQHEEDTEKLTASAEWNRQKEAELNEMLKKMMQSKPGGNRKIVSDKKGAQDVAREKRGGFYDQYKGKRDEKLRGEAAEKRAVKDAQFRAMQEVLEQRKVAMASANATAVTRSKSSLSKPEKLRKSLTPSANTKKESPKPTLAKKAPKTSPSPVRKSWPSVPSPRASAGVSPAKTPCGASSAGTTPTSRKPSLGPTGPQSSPKVERTLQQPKPKPLKATQTDTRKSTKGAIEKKQQPLSKNEKIAKSKAQTVSEKESLKDVSKPSFYNKMTKKGSVVPLESKPFLRKGSGVSLGTGPVVKTKASPLAKEPVKKPENLTLVEENEVSIDSVDLVSQHIPEGDVHSEDIHADLDSEAQDVQSEDTRADVDSKAQSTIQQVEQDITRCHDSFAEKSQSQSDLKTEAEEDLTISPTAWVEEHEDLCIPPDDSKCEISPVVHEGPVATASPRVRHSLSQMLLRESAELDTAEWGNAEIPASIVYQKDAPKGLKKLLKFALKSKGDQTSSGWSSPSVFSEGEDDAEESKTFGKKKADTSLKKSALHASNNELQKTLLGEGHGRDFAGPQRSYVQSNLNNFGAQSSSSRLQDHISGAAANSKATRSFFSLSAFKGNKTNETKLR